MTTPQEIKPGAVFSNGARCVKVAKNAGINGGLRLDCHPPNGIVYAPWFKDAGTLAEYLARGGHVAGTPFKEVLP